MLLTLTSVIDVPLVLLGLVKHRKRVKVSKQIFSNELFRVCVSVLKVIC